MSNKKIVDLNGEKIREKELEPEDIRVEVHPQRIFATMVRKDKTKGGVYLPENVNNKEGTPLVKIMKIGQQAKEQFDGWLELGDYVYVNLAYGDLAVMDDVTGIVIHADAVLGKLITDKDE